MIVYHGSDNGSEYECSPELIQIFDDMDSKIASGELKPQTVEEAAAERGIILD
jgi:hypothetical protein